MKRVLDIVGILWSYTDIEKAVLSALDLLKDLVHFERAIVWLMDPSTALPSRPPIVYNIPSQLIKDYLQHVRLPVDLKAYRATKSAGLKIARSTDVLDYKKWTKSDIFKNYYLPYNAYYEMGCEIYEKKKIYGTIGLTRSKSSGNFSKSNVSVLRLLYPHLLNRLKWQTMLGQPFIMPHKTTSRYAGTLTSLTPREIEVVQTVLAGATNREAADVLNISENTVKLYLKNIYGKLGISNRSQLSALYHTWSGQA
jgi:DNA-binding CsgD family transcriptional regulator